MSDLAFAAAAAGCQHPVDMETLHESQAAVPESPRSLYDSNPFELPSVDDLEVAAAAAAAAMQAMHELQQETEDDEGTSSSSSDSESESDDSSDQSESEDPAAMDKQQQQQQQQQQPQQQQQLTLKLTSGPDGSISVVLNVAEPQKQQQQKGPDIEMVAARGDDADSSSSEEDSSSSSSSSSSSDVESVDYNEMRDFIDKAYKVADDEEDGGPAPSLEEDLGLPGKVVPLTDITVPADAELKQAGSITSVLDGMVVVQGLANSRALDYSSVILLEDKTPIGRIEEVFGPITNPLYALRYAGPQPAPAGVSAESRVFYTDSLASLVEDQVYTEAKTGKKQKAVVEYDPEVEDEPCFSDDEAEAEWRRSQGSTKRKHGSAADSISSGRSRGRGRYGGGPNSSRGGRGGPSAGFRAHATAGQLHTLGLQQDMGGQGTRGRRGGRGRGQQGGRAANGSLQQQPQQQQPPWQPGMATGYVGYPAQQQYHVGMRQMMPGAYGYPAQQMGPYMQQPMPPQPLMMQYAPGVGGYGHPGVVAGPPLHVGGVQQYSMAPPVPAGSPAAQTEVYHNLPSSEQQWTGYGAPPPHSR